MKKELTPMPENTDKLEPREVEILLETFRKLGTCRTTGVPSRNFQLNTKTLKLLIYIGVNMRSQPTMYISELHDDPAKDGEMLFASSYIFDTMNDIVGPISKYTGVCQDLTNDIEQSVIKSACFYIPYFLGISDEKFMAVSDEFGSFEDMVNYFVRHFKETPELNRYLTTQTNL